MSSTISVNVQGKTTNEVITHLEAMLKELRTKSPKAGAPENKMSKKAAVVEEDEDEIDEDEIDVAELKSKKKKAKPAVEEEDEEEEDIDEDDAEDEADEEEEDEDDGEVTLKQARDAILNLGKKKGSSVAKGVLSRHNLKSVAELDKKSSQKYYAPIVSRCKALMAKK